MALALRILLWVIVLLVPGGVLALPLLVAQHTRKLATNQGDSPKGEAATLVGPLTRA